MFRLVSIDSIGHMAYRIDFRQRFKPLSSYVHYRYMQIFIDL